MSSSDRFPLNRGKLKTNDLKQMEVFVLRETQFIGPDSRLSKATASASNRHGRRPLGGLASLELPSASFYCQKFGVSRTCLSEHVRVYFKVKYMWVCLFLRFPFLEWLEGMKKKGTTPHEFPAQSQVVASATSS